MDKRLHRIDKSQSVTKKKVRRVTKKLKEKENFDNESFDNQRMDFDWDRMPLNRNEV